MISWESLSAFDSITIKLRALFILRTVQQQQSG